MKMYLSKGLSVLVVLLMVFASAAGCANNTPSTQPSATDQATAASSAATTTPATPEPAKAPIVLTEFSTTTSEIDTITGGDPGNTPFQKALAKATGVTIKWILATPEDAEQKLQLLISSKDVPNIFGDGQFATTYPGGASQAANDGIIVKLNPYLDTIAQNYKKVLSSKPEYEKNLKADNGDIYGFACFRGGKESTVFTGPIIRKDVLDKAGLTVPETIDEWHTALVAMKSQGFSAPLSMLAWFPGYCAGFVGAYGVCAGYYVGPDDKIHYGPAEDGYKQYLQLMNKWYQEGLLDPDFTTMQDLTVLDTKMETGKSGAALDWLGRIKRYNGDVQKTDPSFNIVAAQYPVLNKGDQPLYGQADNPVLMQYFVGGTDTKNIENAIRWYDYGYSEEGQLLYNFGIEGESYTMKDGVPTYTDEMFNNSKGWSLSQCKLLYTPMAGDAQSLENLGFFEQLNLSTPEQKDAVKIWSNAKQSSELPNLSYNASELIVMKKDGDLGTFVQEQTAQFILGEQSFDKWDAFVQGIKKLGVDDLLTVYNLAYDRYKQRQ